VSAPLCGHKNVWYDCPTCGTSPTTSRFTLWNQQTPHTGPKPKAPSDYRMPVSYLYPANPNRAKGRSAKPPKT
jgi:hypothetical protein